jgi:hemerythrin superfamily protein
MPDVFRLLENDHRNVESMLDELAESSPGPERQQLVDKLASSLQLHMAFEEEAVYPLLMSLDEEMEQEAEVEHRLAREGLTKMAELLDAPGFGAAVEMVKAGIGHHVQEEEQEAFPKLRSSVDADTSKRLTADLLQRKTQAGSLPDDLRQASKSDLLEMAAEAGIESRSSMTKDQLVAALSGS